VIAETNKKRSPRRGHRNGGPASNSDRGERMTGEEHQPPLEPTDGLQRARWRYWVIHVIYHNTKPHLAKRGADLSGTARRAGSGP